MRSDPLIRIFVTVALVTCLVLSVPTGASAQDDQRFLEFEGPLGDRDCHTPNCSIWHELWPNFCQVSHQDNWIDANGDNCLSPCDVLILDGEPWHVEWVGPTFVFEECQFFLEPLQDNWDPSQPPHCQEWIEIYPNHGVIHHVLDWIDANGDGRVSPCDIFIFDDLPFTCHLADIRLDIRIRPAEPVEGCWLNCPGHPPILIDPAGSGQRSPDINSDGIVNLVDFALFAQCFGGPYNACCDLNCDGAVNVVDFALFAAHFAHGPGAPGICAP